jgi:phage/plasmid primase-like uncharacterized protein
MVRRHKTRYANTEEQGKGDKIARLGTNGDGSDAVRN